jgi:hypothetical protein
MLWCELHEWLGRIKGDVDLEFAEFQFVLEAVMLQNILGGFTILGIYSLELELAVFEAFEIDGNGLGGQWNFLLGFAIKHVNRGCTGLGIKAKLGMVSVFGIRIEFSPMRAIVSLNDERREREKPGYEKQMQTVHGYLPDRKVKRGSSDC